MARLLLILPLLLAAPALGHDLSADNAAYVQGISGPAFLPFVYLGAKHMVTGYDHLLFLLGVIFFLYRPRDIVLYVTLFTLGHSLTLLLGVAMNWSVSSHLIDAVIGLSVVYKGFENVGGFRYLLGYEPDTRLAVMVFGLFHGLGFANVLEPLGVSGPSRTAALLGFNVGVELGQLAVVAVAWPMLQWLRKRNWESRVVDATSFGGAIVGTCALVLRAFS